MTVIYHFLEPLDVLYLRGNKLFGDPGSFGESMVPPWPSVAAGALRSAMLAREGVNIAEFAAGRVRHPALGTPQDPGSFRIKAFHLGRRSFDGTVEALYAQPADLVIGKDDGDRLFIRLLRPTPLHNAIRSSAATTLAPVLAEAMRSKPVSGYWLTEAGWCRYLAGQTPDAADLVHSSQLWKLDTRVGVGLDTVRRRAADGKLFTVQAVALNNGGMEKQRTTWQVGFLVGTSGGEPPSEGVVRFGGDGRGAAVHRTEYAPPPVDYEAIAGDRRCRIVLAAPGLFSGNWKLNGIDAEDRFELYGVRGRLVCAAVPRAEVVSGFDLAAWSRRTGGPKPAQRAAPTGSVYWIEDLEAAPDALRRLAKEALWLEPLNNDRQSRRAEGFNNVCIAAWPRKEK